MELRRCRMMMPVSGIAFERKCQGEMSLELREPGSSYLAPQKDLLRLGSTHDHSGRPAAMRPRVLLEKLSLSSLSLLEKRSVLHSACRVFLK